VGIVGVVEFMVVVGVVGGVGILFAGGRRGQLFLWKCECGEMFFWGVGGFKRFKRQEVTQRAQRGTEGWEAGGWFGWFVARVAVCFETTNGH